MVIVNVESQEILFHLSLNLSRKKYFPLFLVTSSRNIPAIMIIIMIIIYNLHHQ
jgi:hypothetical protein